MKLNQYIWHILKGTKYRFKTVAQATPNPRLTAIGCSIRACPDAKKIRDERPKTVVIDVKIIGLSL